MMKRGALNRIIDTFAFAVFVLVVTTGLLLRYLLPPGSGRLHGIGTGYGAAERPVTLLWGLTRQEWGNMHFWISLALMIVLALHLILHWRWIRGSIRGGSQEVSGLRAGLGIVGLLAVVAVAVLPWLSPLTSVHRSQFNESVTESRPATQEGQMASQTRGMMTLQEIEDLTGVPTAYIVERLGLPRHVSPDERLGRLRRMYGFSMQDVRRIVVEYKK
jgi:hypothetical protein